VLTPLPRWPFDRLKVLPVLSIAEGSDAEGEGTKGRQIRYPPLLNPLPPGEREWFFSATLSDSPEWAPSETLRYALVMVSEQNFKNQKPTSN
jgi:hypothetical protein